LNEPRWYDSAEEYRTIQGLVRQGRHREAMERAQYALRSGRLSRRQAARLHSLICWVYTEELHQISPAAVLHGEEAVRLANLLGDAWIKCEALARLTHAYCRMNDIRRARAAVETIDAEVSQNEGALTGGTAALFVLRATVASAESNATECLRFLEEAEAASDSVSLELKARICQQKVGVLLEHERYDEARQVLAAQALRDDGPSPGLEWEMARAWLALAEAPENGVEARRMANQALQRTFAAGRLDLARRFRRRLGHLL
jgi:hypothetical protein